MNDLILPTLFVIVSLVIGAVALYAISRLPSAPPPSPEEQALRDAVDQLQVDIGEALLPPISRLVDSLHNVSCHGAAMVGTDLAGTPSRDVKRRAQPKKRRQ